MNGPESRFLLDVLRSNEEGPEPKKGGSGFNWGALFGPTETSEPKGGGGAIRKVVTRLVDETGEGPPNPKVQKYIADLFGPVDLLGATETREPDPVDFRPITQALFGPTEAERPKETKPKQPKPKKEGPSWIDTAAGAALGWIAARRANKADEAQPKARKPKVERVKGEVVFHPEEADLRPRVPSAYRIEAPKSVEVFDYGAASQQKNASEENVEVRVHKRGRFGRFMRGIGKMLGK